jgi:hypothetical protein
MNMLASDIWSLMSDMQDIPPDAEEELPSSQTSTQPSGIEYLHRSSTPPTNAADSDSVDSNPLQAAFKTAGIRGLLPSALAKEERNARLNESRNKRRSGVELGAEEIRDDLNKILSHLITQLSTHTAGMSIILKMPAQALLYAERTATYALTDYPRSFENDIAITGLWDALERIYIAASDWRKDPNKADGRAVIVSIDRMAKAAVRGMHAAETDDAANEQDSPSDTDSE